MSEPRIELAWDLRCDTGESCTWDARNRRVQLVADFFRFQLDDGIALRERIAFAFDPADDGDFGGIHSAGLGNDEIGNDGEFLPEICSAPEA